MQLNRHNEQSHVHSTRSRNVKQFIDEILEKYRPRLTQQKINIETDLDTFDAEFHPSLLHSAAAALVENAIGSMPNGGEISVTLIDGKHQWELEVADSLGMAYNSFEKESEKPAKTLPVIIPFAETEKLRDAHRAAIAQGGQIQSWNCPQGGTANVLVIPRYRAQASRNQAAPDSHEQGQKHAENG